VFQIHDVIFNFAAVISTPSERPSSPKFGLVDRAESFPFFAVRNIFFLIEVYTGGFLILFLAGRSTLVYPLCVSIVSIT
jgi:hypothetical protein